MTTEKGTLKKAKKGFQVTLTTKKGSADLPIPEAARRFHPQDAADGIEVMVERDGQNRIVKVTIPGKPETSGSVAQPSGRPAKRGSRPPQHAGGRRTPYDGSKQPPAVSKTTKASPKVLGLAFHNPYTFLPFSRSAPQRRQPTPLSADELPGQEGRLTGILELEVATQSPLLTCQPQPIDKSADHKTYPVLRIGPDAIVPATGIRGALRTLLTILTGGTLGYLNRDAHLCQGRDVHLGPRGLNSPPGTPANVFLALVERPGTAFRDGEIRLGMTKLVPLEALERCYGRKLPRKINSPPLWVGLDGQGRPETVTDKPSPRAPWRLKLSGRPVNPKGKREGVFLAGEQTLTLPAELWSAYSGRNAHGDRPELRQGDLVWLEPADAEAQTIGGAEDVRSLQWARWGKRGKPLQQKIPSWVLPDYAQGDGLVDEITDLFGQVQPERGSKGKAPSFAARIRPENLVFPDAAAKVQRVTLAPLAPPHPGCIAFYRDNTDPGLISEQDDLRGYKVYRTTREEGPEAPWHYPVQGVYDDGGQLKDGRQKVCKTCDLLPKGSVGQLRIAFRALTARELALLLQACAVPWRLGGGKPLGLGLCSIRVVDLIDEEGQTMRVPGWTIWTEQDGVLRVDGWEQELADIQPRVRMWIASQTPVSKLRYPRAVEENNFKKSRGGHVWFKRHASPRMVSRKGEEGREPGVEPLHVDGPLKAAAQAAGEPIDPHSPLIAGQILPAFDPEDIEADVLYGYDGYGTDVERRERPLRQVYLRIEPFDPETHITGQEKSEGSHGKDAGFRKDHKRARRHEK